MTVLFRVRTRDLDFKSPRLRALRDSNPSITREMERIDRVRNHGTANTKVILRNGVANTIPHIVERMRHHLGGADRLLDRVDAQVYCTELMSQLPGNRCFSYARKAAQNN